MSVTVVFFASIRERVGRSRECIDIEGISSVAAIWRQVTDIPLPEHILTAVNQEYVPLEQPVRDGDEVAFFPPVTGG